MCQREQVMIDSVMNQEWFADKLLFLIIFKEGTKTIQTDMVLEFNSLT